MLTIIPSCHVYYFDMLNNNNKYVYSPASMQFLEILATHSQQANGGLTNTARVHALLLPSKYY